jgi:hypothetical protein
MTPDDMSTPDGREHVQRAPFEFTLFVDPSAALGSGRYDAQTLATHVRTVS